MVEAVTNERELGNEALGMLDAQDAVIEAQLAEIARLGDEFERMKEHLQVVRSRAFWRRVAQEIWDILRRQGFASWTRLDANSPSGKVR